MSESYKLFEARTVSAEVTRLECGSGGVWESEITVTVASAGERGLRARLRLADVHAYSRRAWVAVLTGVPCGERSPPLTGADPDFLEFGADSGDGSATGRPLTRSATTSIPREWLVGPLGRALQEAAAAGLPFAGDAGSATSVTSAAADGVTSAAADGAAVSDA